MKLPSFILKHPVELVLIITSSITTATSYFLYVNKNSNFSNSDVLAANTHNTDITERKLSDSYFIDVSGAVLNPDLYEVTPGARLKDVIDLAGGLSSEADSFFVGRNFNMAKMLKDQEKIYIPFISDIVNGTFVEETRMLDYLNPVDNTAFSSTENLDNQIKNSEGLISINSATSEELDTLPGIGPTTAQKIIDNRPYSSVDELLSKKVVKSNVFGNIKEFITL
jgi:competence protein ComEA